VLADCKNALAQDMMTRPRAFVAPSLAACDTALRWQSLNVATQHRFAPLLEPINAMLLPQNAFLPPRN
jgi:hypothetical protein